MFFPIFFRIRKVLVEGRAKGGREVFLSREGGGGAQGRVFFFFFALGRGGV
jgi:hypothetical protein